MLNSSPVAPQSTLTPNSATLSYGHPAGDQVLKEVASILTANARGGDVFGRYGGDEFLAILPSTDRETAVALTRRIQSILAHSPFINPEGIPVPLHMSFGIATYPGDSHQASELIVLADANMYESKQRGGNTITSGDQTEEGGVLTGGQFDVLRGLITAVDNKDHYTRQHCDGVARYSLMIAGKIGLSEESERTLRIAGLLHDVGKIGVPDRILRKPGRLTDGELAVVQQHPLLGEAIIAVLRLSPSRR